MQLKPFWVFLTGFKLSLLRLKLCSIFNVTRDYELLFNAQLVTVDESFEHQAWQNQIIRCISESVNEWNLQTSVMILIIILPMTVADCLNRSREKQCLFKSALSLLTNNHVSLPAGCLPWHIVSRSRFCSINTHSPLNGINSFVYPCLFLKGNVEYDGMSPI